ncbi:Fanconi anemia group F protein [Talpa occidentalis]|uniref:Fanconi anemia group F protein n=1 Tax=Talpa occidentalis TaxID=50954 RepID=UPI0018900FED|nr:Fanconi anemia group F protein [Talpa occidentalis]
METLLQQLEHFSQVLAVARTTHVSSWDAPTVRRAFQWARYLRHVHGRFGHQVRIRPVLERRLRSQWKREGSFDPALVPGLTNFQALGRCDLLLSLRLLENPALGDAAYHCLLRQLFPGPGDRGSDEETLQDSLARLVRRRAAVCLLRRSGCGESPALQDSLTRTQAELLLERLREVRAADAQGPSRFLSSLWERLPRDSFLKVIAAALLLPPSPRPQEEELELGDPKISGEGAQELVHWLLGKSDIVTTVCRNLPVGLLTSVAGCHPDFSRAYLALLTDWGRLLQYDLQKGIWVGVESQDVSWEELFGRFQSLCQAPPPLRDQAVKALESCKAQDGDFEVPGVSIWTDLLLALGSGA